MIAQYDNDVAAVIVSKPVLSRYTDLTETQQKIVQGLFKKGCYTLYTDYLYEFDGNKLLSKELKIK